MHPRRRAGSGNRAGQAARVALCLGAAFGLHLVVRCATLNDFDAARLMPELQSWIPLTESAKMAIEFIDCPCKGRSDYACLDLRRIPAFVRHVGGTAPEACRCAESLCRF